MNKLIILFFVGFALSGCDKVKKTEKTLTGIWTAIHYKHTLGTGLSYKYEVSGTMDFGNCGGKFCDYCLNVTYQNETNSIQKYNKGTIEVMDDKNFILNRLNADGTTTVLTYGAFLMINKDDLKMEFLDETGIHQFVFQK